MEYALAIPVIMGFLSIIAAIICFAHTYYYHFKFLFIVDAIKLMPFRFTWDYSHTHFADYVIAGKNGKKVYINLENKTCTLVPMAK